MPNPDINFVNLPTLAPNEVIRITSHISFQLDGYSVGDVTAINIRNNTTGGGYFQLDGVRLPDGVTLDFFRDASSQTGPYDFGLTDISRLEFVGGTGSYSDVLVVNAAIEGFGNVGSDTDTIQTVAPTPEVTVASATASSMYEGGAITYTVELSAPSTTDVRVYYSLTGSGSSPIEASDVTTSSSYFFIPAGQTTGSITVNAVADGVYDGGREQYSIELTSISGNATIGGADTFIGRVDDLESPQPGTLSIRAIGSPQPEGDSGFVDYTFEVTRTGGVDGSVGASWSIVSSSPDVNAQDFVTSMSGSTIGFGSGSSSPQYITVRVSGDTEIEVDELFSVQLSSPTGGASLGVSTATSQILNDDVAAPLQPGTFSISTATTSVQEGDNGELQHVTFDITRTGGSDGQVSIDWGISHLQTNSSDFDATQGGTLTFDDGQTSRTVTVTIVGDVLDEPDESFGVSIWNATGGASIGTSLATSQITNDDAETVVSDTLLYPVNAGSSAGYHVTANPFASGHLANDVNAVTPGNSDYGHEVNTIFAGRITLVEDNRPGGYGGIVMVEHVINGETYTALYSHLTDIPPAVWTAYDNGTEIAAGTVIGGIANGTTSASSFSLYTGHTSTAYDFDGDGVFTHHAWQYAHLHFSISSGSHSTPPGDWRVATVGTPTAEGVATFDIDRNGETVTFYDPWAFIAAPPAGTGNSGGGGTEVLPFTTGSDQVNLTGGTIAYADSGWDRVNGSSGDDTIYGQAGNDTVNGSTGNDHVFGGAGQDSVNGGAGNDTLVGGGQADMLSGGSDDDTVTGGTGNDTIVGGDGADNLDGGEGADQVRGGDDNDIVNGATGNDTLFGGEGHDSVNGGGNSDTLFGNQGNDTLNGGDGADALSGGDNNDTLIGDDGDDFLFGGNQNDVIQGNAGEDTAGGGNGNDTIVGGTGNDSLSGGQGADELRGGQDDDTVIGNTGNDTLFGGAGHDRLLGGDNADTIYGNQGNDTLDGGRGNDALSGGDNNDTLFGAAGDDFLFGGNQNDLIHGDDGDDTAGGGNGNDTILGGAGNDSASGGQGADLLNGEGDNDTLIGNTGSDTLLGAEGRDRLLGGDQADVLYGGTGNDTLSGDQGTDILFGGQGFDVLVGGSDADRFVFNSIDHISGSGGRDVITDFEQTIDIIDLSAVDAHTSLAGNQSFDFIGTAGHSGQGATLRFSTDANNTYVYGDVDGDGIGDFSLRLEGVYSLTASDFLL